MICINNNHIEGIIENDNNLILIEDVITTGNSIINTLNFLDKHCDINIIEIYCIINNTNKNTLNHNGNNINIISILNKDDIENYLKFKNNS
jgi:orotate phosphoribosyltransferase